MLTTRQVKEFIRRPFTELGGYPLFAIADDGGALCAKCCRAEWHNICDSMRSGTADGWRVDAVTINYESDIQCEHCHDDIDAAYLDDDDRLALRAAETARCDQCAELMINGVRCHETGCPNS